MPTELSLAIQQVCEEKNLTPESVKETIEAAIASAYRKDFGNKLQNLKVNFDIETGAFEVFDIKEVVEDALKEEYEKMKAELEARRAAGEEIPVTRERETESASLADEEEKRFNPKNMISLSEAKAEKEDAKIGEQIIKNLAVPADFGRMAAQTAKQVIVQKLREAERETVFNEYKDKQGELIMGTIQRREGRVVLVDLGTTTGVMPPADQVEKENYRSGVRLKFYLRAVEQGQRGPEIIVSRTSPEMLRKLFKLEVPEINSGAVQIKAVAREAGNRSKIAVWAKEENVDPIGACVGQRGTRIQTVINELGGEKIDIIEWDEDTKKFIEKALSPAKVLNVELDEENKVAKAQVKEDQYSLAIGKAGQNVRLAAKLTGWKIDIVMEGGGGTPEEVVEAVAEETSEEPEVKSEERIEKGEEPIEVPAEAPAEEVKE
jgi:transcription termination/antitermination protein NusA